MIDDGAISTINDIVKVGMPPVITGLRAWLVVDCSFLLPSYHNTTAVHTVVSLASTSAGGWKTTSWAT